MLGLTAQNQAKPGLGFYPGQAAQGLCLAKTPRPCNRTYSTIVLPDFFAEADGLTKKIKTSVILRYKIMSLRAETSAACAAKQPRRHAKRRGCFVALAHSPICSSQ
jgi:hypothetical protein